jgi:hypothetical protein
MKPAFCAGIVVQLSISRKRAMKSCHPAESGAQRAEFGGDCYRGTRSTKMATSFVFAPLLHPSKL